MRRLISAALIALPLVGLGYLWYQTAQKTNQGTEWDVPVTGYDPRDLLKGHYVEYRYQWPRDPAQDTASAPDPANILCIHGKAPTITSVGRYYGTEEPKANCEALLHAPSIFYGAAPQTGRLYVSQAEATRLQAQFADSKQQPILRFRLRPDEVITPLRLSFVPKP